jgi:hypothetical protein
MAAGRGNVEMADLPPRRRITRNTQQGPGTPQFFTLAETSMLPHRG